jgi:phage tail sheath protein FI
MEEASLVDLSYRHGVTVVESTDTPSLLRVNRFGIAMFNGTAPDADAAAFPINTPTLVTSLSQASQLGDSWLKSALETYFGEGGSYAIVNRVEYNATPATLQANLIGDASLQTGIYAALRAKDLLSVAPQVIKPRVLVTEGDTGTYVEDGVVSVTITNNGQDYTSVPTVTFSTGDAAATAAINKHKVVSIAITNSGSGYTEAPTIVIAPPPAGGVQATATCTLDDDEIDAITITNKGSGYTEAPAITLTGGGGGINGALTATLGGPLTAITVTDPSENYVSTPTVTIASGGGSGGAAVANLGDVANPFISAFNAVCPQINARAYVAGPNTTNAEAVRWRNTINSGRILPLDPAVLKNVNGTPVQKPIAPVFAGVRARVVASSEGVSGSVSNKVVRTIDGVARTIRYPADSNYLNEQHVNTIINERGGYRTWGSRLATDDLVWAFDSVRATADMINEALEDLYFVYVDRKFTKHNLKMMVEDGNAAMRVFKNNSDILGGRVWLSDLNTPTLNAGGKVFLDVEFEPVGLMEQIHITTYRNILYYQLLLDDVRGAIENGPLTLAA